MRHSGGWLFSRAFAAAAVVILGSAGAAFAHDFALKYGKENFQPLTRDAMTGVRSGTMHIGDGSVSLVVFESNEPPCSAFIRVLNVGGTSAGARVSPLNSITAKTDFAINIQPSMPGTITFEVTVEGDHKPCGMMMTAEENSTTQIVITVTADATATAKTAASYTKARLKELNRTLRSHVMSLPGTFNQPVAMVRSGAATPVEGLWMLGNAALTGLVDQQRTVGTSLTGLRNDFNTLIVDGNYPVGCTPPPLTRGGYGSWDSAIYGAWTGLYQGSQGLSTAMWKALVDIANFASTPTSGIWIGGSVFPPPIPPITPPNNGMSPALPSMQLGIGVLMGVSEHAANGTDTGWVWAAGWSDPLNGALGIRLTPPTGSAMTSTVNPDAGGKWSVQFTGPGLKNFGLNYRLDVGYAGDQNVRSEYVVLPKNPFAPRF